MEQHIKYMKEALKQAKKAYALGEVPIGCVIVYEDKIIARGYNKRNLKKTTLAHAEIIAIAKAGKVINDWRLEDCTMYITLEPCPMCAGALAWSQIGKVVYGASDSKRGFSLFSPSMMHPKTEVVSGVMAEECGTLVSDFFRNKRS